MTAAEVRDWLTLKLESMRPSTILSAPFSPDELDRLNEWWKRQIECRITMELCTKLAALGQRGIILDHCLRELNRALATMLLEMRRKVAASEGDGSANVLRIGAAQTKFSDVSDDRLSS